MPDDPSERDEREEASKDFSSDDYLSLLYDEGAGEIPRPYVVGVIFLFKAMGVEGYADLNLEELVTAESLQNWHLEDVADIMRDHGPSTAVRYLGINWAMLPLVKHDGAPFIITEPTPAVGLFLKYVDDLKDWRVHLIGNPSWGAEQLP